MIQTRVAIAMGDPAGVGPQVVSGALKKMGRAKDAVFFVAGDALVLSRYGFSETSNVRLADLGCLGRGDIKPGKPNTKTAAASIAYLKEAVSWIRSGRCDALVTAPISKESVRKAGFRWPGHTEFLSSAFGVKDVEMVFIGDHLKVSLATRHMSLKKAIASLTRERIVACGRASFELLQRNFALKKPRIAVCGLNPHAGESGMFGDEEGRLVAPAVKQLNKIYGPHFSGPLASDAVFHQALKGAFDLVIALYHDQGLIAFKTLEFDTGIQLTAGLPFIRTSPAHGTAYDIAGTRRVDERSMQNAILWAARLAKNTLR